MQIKIRATVYADALIFICLNIDCFIDVGGGDTGVHRVFKLLTLVS